MFQNGIAFEKLTFPSKSVLVRTNHFVPFQGHYLSPKWNTFEKLKVPSGQKDIIHTVFTSNISSISQQNFCHTLTSFTNRLFNKLLKGKKDTKLLNEVKSLHFVQKLSVSFFQFLEKSICEGSQSVAKISPSVIFCVYFCWKK